jgi:hypothetical protein
MMAVSALSLAHQDGGQNIDALQHYQQAFPSLQTCLRRNEDLSSDGVFLTHFLLLIYEVSNHPASPAVVANVPIRLRLLNLAALICGRITSPDCSRSL